MNDNVALIFNGEEVSKRVFEIYNKVTGNNIDGLISDIALGTKLNDMEDEALTLQDCAFLSTALLSKYFIGSEKFQEMCQVKEFAIDEYIKENPSKFIVPKRAKCRQIFTSEMEKANEVMKELKDGVAFEELVTKYSECSSAVKGGDIGYIPFGVADKDFNDAAFNNGIGNYSQVVESPQGFHILITDEILEAEEEPDESKKRSFAENNIYSENVKNFVEDILSEYEIEVNDDLLRKEEEDDGDIEK